jgi:citrate lyase subunit beta/citryl-CoA lyase
MFVLDDIRSLLFVPAHDRRKLAKGLECGADALILDLEDSIPEDQKTSARRIAAEFTAENRTRLPLFVRVNALSTGLLLDDLAAIVQAHPFGIVLPKCANGQEVARISDFLTALEVREKVREGAIHILPIVTECAVALLEMSSYAHHAGPRLCGMMWGGEDLAVDIGASVNRVDGNYTQPFQLSRSLCLFGAASARVKAIDAVYTDFRDEEGLTAECCEAAAAGFRSKAAIHPAQVAAINAAFPKVSELLRDAEAIVAAFDQQPGAWTVDMDGCSYDRVQLLAAQRVLAARRGGT